MSITWKADVYVTQDGRIIELPFREEFSISELEEMEAQDKRNHANFMQGLMVSMVMGGLFWFSVYWRFIR